MSRKFNATSNTPTNGGYITSGQDTPFRFTNAVTLACWINYQSMADINADVNHSIFGKIVTPYTNGYVLRAETTAGTLKWYCYISGAFRTATAANLSINTWYHVASTYDGTTGTVYINGAASGTTFTQAGSITNAACNFAIGNLNDGNDADFSKASFFDAAAYNAVLTPGEIASLAAGNRPCSVRPKSLVAYWPLDGLASPEPDFSGNVYNGVLKNVSLVSSDNNGPATMCTPKWPQLVLPTSVPAVTAVFRKTASRVGTRTGTRQTWAA